MECKLNIIVQGVSESKLYLFQLPDWLMENEFWINMIAYSHAMINPIIYITFNENFKKSFKRLMCCTDDEITYEYSNRKY